MSTAASAQSGFDGAATRAPSLHAGLCWLDPGRLWPAAELALHLDFSNILNSLAADAIDPVRIGAVGSLHAGLWECNLADHSLVWSGGVFDIFGLSRSAPVTREQALACYTDDSRTRLEQIRGEAIRRHQGFTIDIEIRAAGVGEARSLRVIGAPQYDRGVPVRLHGLKLLV